MDDDRRRSRSDPYEQVVEGLLRPVPHLDAAGSPHPPLLALAGFDDEPVSSFEVIGDSMHPDLNAGDLVIFSLNSANIEDGGLYVLAGRGGLTPRRIQVLSDGRHLAVPTNPAYGREPLDPQAGPAIVGTVVAVVRRTP